MKNTWLTQEGVSALYFIEQQIYKTMTQKLGWTECIEDNHIDRFNNFLDYLEETYVIPTTQIRENDSANSSWGGGRRTDVQWTDRKSIQSERVDFS